MWISEVSHLHHAGVIHRNLTPENVFLDPRSGVVNLPAVWESFLIRTGSAVAPTPREGRKERKGIG